MLSDRLTTYAHARFEARRALLASVMPAVEAALATCADMDEQTLLRYLYGTLPITDCLDVTPDVLLSHVRHALLLRHELPWTRELGEGMFVHYVLCPRINTEPIVDCRHTFWELLRERVRGLDAYAAVREVNYWCAEMATYQTTDGRTLSPLAVLASGNGRCGEESTFLVTALRSVGIPARQIYTPWWAHCDDNHAWVEAFCAGGWHYLGACEPEEELDRGWFTNAAGRALMEETRLFSDFRDDSVPEPGAGTEGSMTIVNVTDSYAPSQTLEIEVADEHGPVSGATVAVEILNSASWMPAATLVSAPEPLRVRLGLGSVRASASAGGLLGMADVDTRVSRRVTVRLGKPQDVLGEALDTWRDLDVYAPSDHPAPSRAQTPEQDARARSRKTACDAIRRARVKGFAAKAAALAAKWPGSEHAFACSFANAPELAAFLSVDAGPDRLELLGTLTDKDFRDVRAELLESHLSLARTTREDAEARLRAQGLGEQAAHETYVASVLCPRTSYEELSDYRPFVLDFFAEEEHERFARDPRALWAWLGAHLSFDGREGLARPIGTPAGALTSGIGSPATRAHIFVAVCRTLGVAARLNPETGHPEFMEAGSFTGVEGADDGTGSELTRGSTGAEDAGDVTCVRRPTTTVTLTCDDVDPVYHVAWTIGRLEPYLAANCREALGFRTLDLTGKAFDHGRLSLELAAGLYRLVSTTRLPNGNQQASERIFCVADQDEVRIELRHRAPKAADMLNTIELPAFSLADDAGASSPLELGPSGLGVLAFLDESAEPTEHLLNELRERADAVRAAGLSVTFALRTPDALADPTLTRTLAALPEARIAFADFSELPERLARRTYVNPELLPLTLLVRSDARTTRVSAGSVDRPVDARAGGLTSLFATAGYNVGTVDLLLRLARLK